MGIYDNVFEAHTAILEDIETGETVNLYQNWHLVSKSRLFVAPPEPKYVYQEIDGSDGIIDETMFPAERVLYKNRKGTWTFYLIDVPYFDMEQTFHQTYSDILNFLQGQKFKVYINSDPSFYWVGRLHISNYQTESNRFTIELSYEFEPYKYEIEEEYRSDTINVSGAAMSVCFGSDMEVSPLFDITSTDYVLNPNEKLTRGEAIDILYQASTFLGSSKAHTSTTSKYLDVFSSNPYFDALLWNQDRGYVTEYTSEIFAPNNPIGRGQFLNALYALKNKPSASGKIPFKDVKENNYCFKAVRWAFSNGYVSGSSNDKFNPNGVITRAQATHIVWLVAGSPTNSNTTNFIDLKNGGDLTPWYYDAVVWAKRIGTISGFDDGTFRPANELTRAQFIQILFAFSEEGDPPPSSYDCPFDDVDEDAYYYDAVRWAWNNGVDPIMNGKTADTFAPNVTILRKEAYAVIYKMYQRDFNYCQYDPDTDRDQLDGIMLPSDVLESAYYWDAVCWALIYNTTTLDGGYRFRPDDKCTRAMAVQILYAAKCNSGVPQRDTTAPFKDVKITHLYYVNACKWAVQNGILTNAKQAGMTVTISNEYHDDRTMEVPSGTDSVEPYLVITKGRNEVTFEGNGTAVIHYRKGRL